MKSLKTIIEKIDKILNQNDRSGSDIYYMKELFKDIRSDISQLRKDARNAEIVQSQQRTIEQLTNALKDKYEHGLFIFSEDGKIPTVIRNGKQLTSNLTTSFSIDWTTGEFPNIQFEQFGGTSHDIKE